jgi:hypothetical protein
MFGGDDDDYDDYSHEYGLTRVSYINDVPVNGNNNDDDEPTAQPLMVADNNPHMIQAESDKYGILRRYNEFTGENKNNVSFRQEPEQKINLHQDQVKFLPGERLLMSIAEEKPELIKKAKYKKISTTRRNKLKLIKDKLFDERPLEH